MQNINDTQQNGAFLWNIRKVVNKGEYQYAVVPEHPNKIKHGYVLLHRVLLENHLGRLLNSNEIVHHVNENKRDNSIENLQIMNSSQHARLHMQKKGKTMLSLQCPLCGSIFSREKRLTHIGNKRGKYTCCAKSCKGKLNRMSQLNRITKEMENAISVNILGEFNTLDNTEGTPLQGTP